MAVDPENDRMNDLIQLNGGFPHSVNPEAWVAEWTRSEKSRVYLTVIDSSRV